MNYKKRLSVVLTATMVLACGLNYSYAKMDIETLAGTESTPSQGSSAAVSGAAFADISGHWAEFIIKEAADMKIVGGYPEGNFLPDNLIKREEFYKLLSNILTEKPDTANTKIQFTDVVADEWYIPTIKIAVAAGITSGYGDGTFGIGMMISRQEAAKVAGSVIAKEGVDDKKGAETARDKGQIADWAYNYVDLMFKKGYMKGDTEGNFRPTMALTRAEAATILLNIKKNEPVIGANFEGFSATGCMEKHKGQGGTFVKGSGTKNEPYEVATEEQLNHIRIHATEGAFYVLTKNIAITKDYAVTPPAVTSGEPNWTEGNFQPIGNEEEPFKGSLKGNGYTISGLIISGTAGRNSNKTEASYAGLFGYLARGSVVTKLVIDASDIRGNQYTGAVAGYNEGIVEICRLGTKGIVNGGAYVGGLVGYSLQPLTSSKNQGTVTGKEATGGIAGAIDTTGIAFRDCRNEGAVNGNGEAGGIVGVISSSGGTVTVRECYNDGTVTGGSAGGIAGSNAGTISGCYNTGTVEARLDAGGIAAYQQDGQGRVTRCYNEGRVTSEEYAGGILGNNGSRIDNCYNSGRIAGTGIAGGIAGISKGTITNVYGAGFVTGNKGRGGIAGRNSGVLSNAYWLGSTAADGIGLSDPAFSPQAIRKVTHEELSGQIKMKTSDGYELLVDIMNRNNKTQEDVIDKTEPETVWKHLYTVVRPAASGSTVVSDGGGIVPPIGLQSQDSAGNVIGPEDLNTKYLYPALIF